MRMGAHLVGGVDPATVDGNIEKSLNTIMDIAVEFDSDIDIHLHDGSTRNIYNKEISCINRRSRVARKSYD